MSHNQGHNHSSHDHQDHGHDHGHETEPALQTLIWKQIDFDNIRTLNESEPDAGAKIVKKTWQQRLESDLQLESDADEQLLMFVPYVAALSHQTYEILTSHRQLRRRPEAARHPHQSLHLRLLSPHPQTLPQPRRRRLRRRVGPRAHADADGLADQRRPGATGQAGQVWDHV